MQRAEQDWRIKTALKDRLPTNVDIIFDHGDQVVFREGKEGKLHEGRIIGFDGPIAIV